MKVFYWSPFISKVATIKAVINSAAGLKKYTNADVFIIDSFGEWQEYANEINTKGVKIIKIYKDSREFFSNKGFLNSRLSFIRIFLRSFFPLLSLINKEKPDYFIAQLITSIPLLLFSLYKFNTKLILRVSGLVRFSFLRKVLWYFSGRNIYKITFPTLESLVNFEKKKIIDKNKIVYLPDPVFSILDLKRKASIFEEFHEKKYIISVGRLTKQKNHKFLIECFFEISKKIPNLYLIILGEGEERVVLENTIKILGLENKVILRGHVNDPYSYIKKSICLVSTSLWEDPGFVIIESLLLNTIVISSDCPSGPTELLSDGSGFLFNSNNKKDFLKVFYLFYEKSKEELQTMKIKGKKISRNFSFLKHSLKLRNILSI